MAHIGRTVKNVEAPRPLKSQSRSSLKNNYMLIEELIQLIENVALTLQSGINNTEPMAALVQNLRIHGPQLETVSKDTLDRAFVVFRNASQDERLNIMTRLNLLELIELRAKGWEDNGFNSYYKTKQVTNIDLPDGHIDLTQTGFLSTSPTFGGAGAAAAAAIAAVGSAQQTQLLLAPGEVIRNSGKFPKPTKIPGKTYCKDEVVIRNADSGKVMGIKGRRVHMIEELSETIISFQRVNPGAKERLVQITGPTEEKINYAKQLIEDTIRRNASPVRLDPAIGGGHVGGGGSCSSLASSNSDDAVTPRTPGAGVSGNSSLSNRLSFNSAQNFMTASAAAAVAAAAAAQQQQVMNMMGTVVGSTSTPTGVAAAGKVLRPNQQMLLHSFSTNDASLGEYKYTVNVGQHLIKITGDCCDLVRVAKLVLDDYFSSAEFLASVEAGAAFDGSIVSPISTPSTPMAAAPQFMMGTPLHAAAPPLADSGIGLNYMATQGANYGTNDVDDEVFADPNATSQNNGLSRSRRSHFSRKDSTPEAAANSTAARGKKESSVVGAVSSESTRIVHEYEHLLYYAKSPHSWALPVEWQKICEKFPAIVRNKVNQQLLTTTTNSTNVTNTAQKLRVASSITASTVSNITLSTPSPTTFSTALAVRRNIASNDNCIINDHSYTNAITKGGGGGGCGNNAVSTNNVISSNLSMSAIKSTKQNILLTQQQQQAMHIHSAHHINQHHNRHQLYEFQQQTSLHIKRKGFFNRQIVSIDEEGYDALQQQQIQLQQQQYPTERYYNHNNTNILTNTNSYYRTCNVQQQQRTDTNANNCNQQQQQIHYQQHSSQNQQQLQQQKPHLQQQYPVHQQYPHHPQQQYPHNAQQQQQMVSYSTGLTTGVPNYAANIASYSGANPGGPPTNNITTTFHSNGNANVASTSSNLENKPQKLLNKQIKMISSIMESTTQPNELARNENQSNKLNDSTNKQNKIFVASISQSSAPTTTANEKQSNNKFSDSTHKKRSSGGVDQKHANGATNVAANKKSDVVHAKETKMKSYRKGRNKNVIQIVDGDETENWDTDESDVEFVSETKYIKPEIVITADVKANQRRATERPKFMRSNSTCN